MHTFICLYLAILGPIVLSLLVFTFGEPLPKVDYFEDDLQMTYGDIIFSSILFRHGDRNEVYTFKTDEHHKRFEHGDEEMGQLVKLGRQRAYQLGVWARAHYNNLLSGQKYNSNLLKVISSNVERTLQSAQLFLAGFFPPSGDKEIWNNTILWQPIPVYPVPHNIDNIIGLGATCPRYNMEVYKFKESKEMRKFYKTFDKIFIDHIENGTGLEIPRNDAIQAISLLSGVYDTLFVQKNLGLELPSWAEEIYFDRLNLIGKMYFQILVFNEKTMRLKAGPLLKNIINEMVQKRYSKHSLKIFNIYSGHDTTLTVLLSSLGVYHGTPPPYSAAVFVELRLKEGEYFVTVLYKNSDTEQPTLLELPNCKNPCTLDGFIQTLLPLIPSSWENECYHFEPDYNSILF